ncbi:OLC1v1009205C1 [Oldenlandia corymbosa var. corymbosa]|uniref:OLC1v1009205C1 n=1 Tax=Oldenlandia corymbosa var. corymbosa TaxID=529605 RepID=A0AAV1DNH2_OLDCO|nr:OLC1v1009205C1 [Oldenlandia corymbosa var. corymbosa]
MVDLCEEIEAYPLSPTSSDLSEGPENEDISYDDLKKRMWRDRIHLQKLKDQRRDDINNQEPGASKGVEEMSKRKKMARAQDSILKYMVKIMEVCDARGFVYGIVPDKGKAVTGSSESLREWWKEKVKFDQNAPSAITEFLPKILEEALVNLTQSALRITPSEEEEEVGENDDGGIIDLDKVEDGGGEKRKCTFDREIIVDALFACQFLDCPRSHLEKGFSDKNLRTEHESNCAYGGDIVNEDANTNYFGHGGASEIVGERSANQPDWMDLLVARNDESNDDVQYRNYWEEDHHEIDHHHQQQLIRLGESTYEDNMDLNVIPSHQQNLDHNIPQEVLLHAPSIWDLAYEEEYSP